MAANRKAPAKKAAARQAPAQDTKAEETKVPAESTPGADDAAAQNPDTAGDQASGDDTNQDAKDPTPPAPAAKDKPQGALIKVEAKTDSFWRAGTKWSRQARVVPLSAFTEEQLQQLKDEPLLVVTPVDSETLDDD